MKNKQFIIGAVCAATVIVTVAADYDLNKGIDMTGSTSVTAAKLNQLVDNATVAANKGMLIYTNGAPSVVANPRFSRFIWMNSSFDPPRPFTYKTNGAYWTNVTAISPIEVGSVVTASIADAAVTSAKLATNSVTDVKILAGAITSAKYAAGSISNTHIAGLTIRGTNLATGTILATNLSQIGGVAFQTLRINAAASGVEWQNGGTIQYTNVTISTVVDCNTIIPVDNTIPTITEGVQVLTTTFTPRSLSSKLKLEFVLTGTASSNQITTATLHINGASASYAVSCGANVSSMQLVGCYTINSGSLAAKTITIRAGPSGLGSFYVNGNSAGAGLYGGVCYSSLTITEIY